MNSTESLASTFFQLFLRVHRLMDRRMAEQGASLARTKLLLFLQSSARAFNALSTIAGATIRLGPKRLLWHWQLFQLL